MGLPDDNPSSFGHHCGIGRHAGLESFKSCWQDLMMERMNWILLGGVMPGGDEEEDLGSQGNVLLTFIQV
jgi:hypothetical protein